LADFSDAPGAAEYRERVEYARTQARQRCRDYLEAVFDTQGFTDSGAPQRDTSAGHDSGRGHATVEACVLRRDRASRGGFPTRYRSTGKHREILVRSDLKSVRTSICTRKPSLDCRISAAGFVQ
jgi:hypothetical protein